MRHNRVGFRPAEIQENLRKAPKSNLQGRLIGVIFGRSFTP
jgi:hypothetical protein